MNENYVNFRVNSVKSTLGSAPIFQAEYGFKSVTIKTDSR